ncbi:hypothetical protein M2138_000437 [Dysgonomonadaceae bacterium PH5-43]|nr:hypothetical protein [Dysgonomonadaceae bacterium PH5-43]
MKRMIFIVFLMLFVNTSEGFSETKNTYKSYPNNIFESRIDKVTSSFTERGNGALSCPMCGVASFGGLCSSCNYASNTALGSNDSKEGSVPVGSGLVVLSVLSMVYVLKKIKVRAMRC